MKATYTTGRRPSLCILAFCIFGLALAAGCSKGGAVKADEPALSPPFRPWGILGAKIANTRDGVMIREVVQGSAADQARLQTGDIITSVSGVTDLRTEVIIDHIRGRLPGSEIEIGYTRRGVRAATRVTVGEYPRDEQI